MTANHQPLNQTTQSKIYWYALTVFSCFVWLAVVTGLSISLYGRVALMLMIVATLSVVVTGKYYRRSPRLIYNISSIWIRNLKYTATILVITAVGIPAGRSAQTEQAAFHAMSVSAHLEAAREHKEHSPSESRRHLAEIPITAPEHEAAAQLLRDIDPEERRIYDRLQTEKVKAAQLATEEAERRQFKEMSSTQHLEAARNALMTDYDRKERIGGDLEEAAKHLGEISTDAPESKQRDSLQKEIADRRQRTARVWYRAVRQKIALDLDKRLLEAGVNVDSVKAVGKDYTVLRINYALCSRVFLNRITPSEIIDSWRSKGFTRVECPNDDGDVYLNLQ